MPRCNGACAVGLTKAEENTSKGPNMVKVQVHLMVLIMKKSYNDDNGKIVFLVSITMVTIMTMMTNWHCQWWQWWQWWQCWQCWQWLPQRWRRVGQLDRWRGEPLPESAPDNRDYYSGYDYQNDHYLGCDYDHYNGHDYQDDHFPCLIRMKIRNSDVFRIMINQLIDNAIIITIMIIMIKSKDVRVPWLRQSRGELECTEEPETKRKQRSLRNGRKIVNWWGSSPSRSWGGCGRRGRGWGGRPPWPTAEP